jgi:hypothetical protein
MSHDPKKVSGVRFQVSGEARQQIEDEKVRRQKKRR